jgi:hypothetical protein
MTRAPALRASRLLRMSPFSTYTWGQRRQLLLTTSVMPYEASA